MTTISKSVSKDSLKSSLVSIGGILPGISAKSYKEIIGANDKVRMGAIGVNSRGNALALGFAREKGCEITYVCDVDKRAMEKCIANIYNITNYTPAGENDFRVLLENKDIDAVIIATPEHWHAPATLLAMKAGKHIYLEKPTSHNPAEDEILMQAANKYKVKVATGMQRRSWPNIIAAIQEIKEGTIGTVNFGKSWYANNRASIGKGKICAIPGWLDWDLWQGPAPRVAEFKDNYLHYNWHWFHNWGTGEAGGNAVHFIDILRWGMNLYFPTRVDSFGDRYMYDDDWEFPDTQIINLEFGDEKLITWEGRSCNGRSTENETVGAAFYGNNGSLVIGGGNSYKIYDLQNNLIKNVKSDMSFRAGDTVNPTQKLDSFHFSNFLDNIRKDTILNADINVGCISTTLTHLGNIAQKTKSSLKINPSNGKILNNKNASKLWSRTYQKGWEMRL